MRDGCSPTEAAQIAILRVQKAFPNFMGGIVAANKKGEYGAACNWLPTMETFSYCVASPETDNVTIITVNCLNSSFTPPICGSAIQVPSTASIPPSVSSSKSGLGFTIYRYLLSLLFIN